MTKIKYNKIANYKTLLLKITWISKKKRIKQIIITIISSFSSFLFQNNPTNTNKDSVKYKTKQK